VQVDALRRDNHPTSSLPIVYTIRELRKAAKTQEWVVEPFMMMIIIIIIIIIIS
jgi:hypothetical protein